MEFSLSIAQEQARCKSKLKEQNKQLHIKVGHNKASTKCDSENQQSDETYPDLNVFFETDVDIQSVTDKRVNSVNVCGARKRLQGIEERESFPPNPSVAKALGPRDIL